MSDKICQYEKYGICKLKKECPNYHPTLVCDDEKCTIKQCRKRHPVTCRYASVGVCQFGKLYENRRRIGWFVKLFLLFTLYCHQKDLDRKQEDDIYI